MASEITRERRWRQAVRARSHRRVRARTHARRPVRAASSVL